MKKEKRIRLKQEKQAEQLRQAQLEAQLKLGEGTPEKPIRSEADGKENQVLKQYMRKYQNVDDNIVTVKHKLCPYQLVHEGQQFRMEHPGVSPIFTHSCTRQS